MAVDYYNILGVSKNAGKEEIKKAYKELAKKHHPDLHKGDKEKEAKFKEINEAYKILSDDKKRSNYDRFGTSDFSDQGYSSDYQSQGFDFSDIFEGVFGRGFGERRNRGDDLLTQIEITLEEAFKGVEKNLTVKKQETCSDCNGSGAKSEADIKTCGSCQGSGYVRRVQRTPFGSFASTTPCSSCRGTGREIKNYCSKCDGKGKVLKTKTLKVKIPEGMQSGMRLRMDQEGEAGDFGMAPGDLYVEIIIQEHDLFERKGDDVYLSIPISFVQAVLGSEIEVKTLDGKVKLKIPEGTQSHTVFRLKGKGMPHIRAYGNGDQKVRVIVQVPEKLTKKQREILEQFAEEGGDKVQEVKKGFFRRLFF